MASPPKVSLQNDDDDDDNDDDDENDDCLIWMEGLDTEQTVFMCDFKNPWMWKLRSSDLGNLVKLKTILSGAPYVLACRDALKASTSESIRAAGTEATRHLIIRQLLAASERPELQHLPSTEDVAQMKSFFAHPSGQRYHVKSSLMTKVFFLGVQFQMQTQLLRAETKRKLQTLSGVLRDVCAHLEFGTEEQTAVALYKMERLIALSNACIEAHQQQRGRRVSFRPHDKERYRPMDYSQLYVFLTVDPFTASPTPPPQPPSDQSST
jgi:hypothetical protein